MLVQCSAYVHPVKDNSIMRKTIQQPMKRLDMIKFTELPHWDLRSVGYQVFLGFLFVIFYLGNCSES